MSSTNSKPNAKRIIEGSDGGINFNHTENLDIFFGNENVSGGKEVEDLLRVFIAKDRKK